MSNITHIVILDNGAHSIKAGFSTDKVPVIIPNCVTKVKSERRRPFIGDQLEECKDYSGLFYILPFNRGFLLNWEVQRQVWDYLFRTKLKLPVDGRNRFSRVGLIITEPVYNFAPLRLNLIEFLFEDYGFGEVLICSAAQLAAFQYLFEENTGQKTTTEGDIVISSSNKDSSTNTRETNATSSTSKSKGSEVACLVVDSGFSFTHVVPFIEGHKVLTHTKRIDVGGKVLTNHLKDIISYRQLNVLDETYVVNQMKEDCCFVSTSFWDDLDTASSSGKRGSSSGKVNTIARDYVLPDYISFKRGFIYEKEKHREVFNATEHQRIRMNNERFQVPELLFNPGDVNIDQVGVSHTILHAVAEFTPSFDHSQASQGAESPETGNPSTSANSTSNNHNHSSTAPSNTSTGAGRTNLRDIDTDEEGEGLEEEEEVVKEKVPEKVEPVKKLPQSKKMSKKALAAAEKKKAEKVVNGSVNGHAKGGDQAEEDMETTEDDEKTKEENREFDLSVFQDENVQSHLYNNILLIGGNCAFPNFAQRVYSDIRSSAPDLMTTRVRLPESPATFAWKGGRTLCTVNEKGQSSSSSKTPTSLFHKYSIKRKEYDDEGPVYCAKKVATLQLPTFAKL